MNTLVLNVLPLEPLKKESVFDIFMNVLMFLVDKILEPLIGFHI